MEGEGQFQGQPGGGDTGDLGLGAQDAGVVLRGAAGRARRAHEGGDEDEPSDGAGDGAC
jgi:hypothetical protein